MGSTLEEQVSACLVGQCFSSPVHKLPGGGYNFTPSVSIFALIFWQMAIENRIVLRAAHIAGVRNVLADH